MRPSESRPGRETHIFAVAARAPAKETHLPPAAAGSLALELDSLLVDVFGAADARLGRRRLVVAQSLIVPGELVVGEVAASPPLAVLAAQSVEARVGHCVFVLARLGVCVRQASLKNGLLCGSCR